MVEDYFRFLARQDIDTLALMAIGLFGVIKLLEFLKSRKK